MSDTITSFFNFERKTPAKSSEVNQNFSAMRGDLIPIAEDTQTSTDNENSLGLVGKYYSQAFTQEWTFALSAGANILFNDSTTMGYQNRLCFLTNGSLVNSQFTGFGQRYVSWYSYQFGNGATSGFRSVLGGNFTATGYGENFVAKVNWVQRFRDTLTFATFRFRENFSATISNLEEREGYKYLNGRNIDERFPVTYLYFHESVPSGQFRYDIQVSTTGEIGWRHVVWNVKQSR